MYTIREIEISGALISLIIRDSDQACIPVDEGNADYQIYQIWLEEGGKPYTEKVPGKDYKARRADLYAPIQDQLDMLYNDMTKGTTTWVDHITSVKAAVPKP